MDAEKTISSSKELLSGITHVALDTHEATEASGINPKLVTVEMMNRSKDAEK